MAVVHSLDAIEEDYLFLSPGHRLLADAGLVVGSPLYNRVSFHAVTPQHLDRTITFAFQDSEPEFFNFLRDPFLLGIAQITVELHAYERKANKDPYVKHLFATVAELWQPYVAPLLQRGMIEEARFVVASAYLHDVIEIQRKYHVNFTPDLLAQILSRLPGANQHRTKRIIDMVAILTPDVEGEIIEDNQLWVDTKLLEFRTKMKRGAGADTSTLHLIKAADMIANIRETYEDLLAGRDKDMRRPLPLRLQVFKQRIEEFLAMVSPYHPLRSRLIEMHALVVMMELGNAEPILTQL